VRLGVVLFLRCCLVGWLYLGCLEGGGDSYSVITGYERLGFLPAWSFR
jgi:hypothetical protein